MKIKRFLRQDWSQFLFNLSIWIVVIETSSLTIYTYFSNSFAYQVVAAFMMMKTLNDSGYKAFHLSIPSPRELLEIFEIAAPVFITMTSKVLYSVLPYYNIISLVVCQLLHSD